MPLRVRMCVCVCVCVCVWACLRVTLFYKVTNRTFCNEPYPKLCHKIKMGSLVARGTSNIFEYCNIWESKFPFNFLKEDTNLPGMEIQYNKK